MIRLSKTAVYVNNEASGQKWWASTMQLTIPDLVLALSVEEVKMLVELGQSMKKTVVGLGHYTKHLVTLADRPWSKREPEPNYKVNPELETVITSELPTKLHRTITGATNWVLLQTSVVRVIYFDIHGFSAAVELSPITADMKQSFTKDGYLAEQGTIKASFHGNASKEGHSTSTVGISKAYEAPTGHNAEPIIAPGEVVLSSEWVDAPPAEVSPQL